MAVNAIRVPVVNDNQIFEYSNTLSLPISDQQAHLEPGDVVIINADNGIAGILQTKVRPTTATPEKALGDVLTAPTYGLNGPGYASVRVAGGVFELVGKVANGGAKVGDPVYVKAPISGTAKPEITTNKVNADVMIGWLKEPLAASPDPQKMQVVLAPAKTA